MDSKVFVVFCSPAGSTRRVAEFIKEECPVSSVVLNPYPEFDRNCFDCFNCIRFCPESAIEPAISMEQIEHHIRERVRTINERPLTEIFL